MNVYHNQGNNRPVPEGKDNPAKDKGKVHSDSLSFKQYCKPGDRIKMPKDIGGSIKNKSDALDILG